MMESIQLIRERLDSIHSSEMNRHTYLIVTIILKSLLLIYCSLFYSQVAWVPYTSVRAHHPFHQISFFCGSMRSMDVIKPIIHRGSFVNLDMCRASHLHRMPLFVHLGERLLLGIGSSTIFWTNSGLRGVTIYYPQSTAGVVRCMHGIVPLITISGFGDLACTGPETRSPFTLCSPGH